MSAEQLRNIPAVDQLLIAPPLNSLVERLSREVVVRAIRARLDSMRSEVLASGNATIPPVGDLAQEIATDLTVADRASLRPVINATGVLLHTGLGRAPLAAEAIEDITAVARGYASVEVDLDSGKRSQRVAAVESLLTEQTGAEAAVVVNNNAGATMLALAAIAGQGGEVIVSRGELIEIGGSFRLPDVMQVSGAKLREVGTTNKTRLSDYRDAIGETTAGMMLVHTSNYVVLGFSDATPLAELVALGRERNLPVIHDIGSGALVDLSRYGCHEEPVASDSIRAGADLVFVPLVVAPELIEQLADAFDGRLSVMAIPG
ncbi:MAG: L-seryl-tRNA(Sec) selenium transferase, partial [Pirellulales bacterium]|nr:L-seryl-tRNA(Sec) selenium transferase [Pirellulales bacterium]